MTSALFTINGGTAGVAADVSASSTVNLALASTSGVRSVTWTIFGTSGSDFPAPTITKSGAPSGVTASFTIPAGAGQAYGIRCVVNNGRNEVGQVDNSLTSQSAVYVLYPSGRRPFFAGETTESDSVYGWTERINEVVAEQSGVLDHDIDMDGYSILNVGSITGVASSSITVDNAQFEQIYVGTGDFASTGEIAMQNNKSIKMRNGANSADVTVASVSNLSVFETGTNSSQYVIKTSSNTKMDIGLTTISLAPVTTNRLTLTDTTSTFGFSGGNIVIGGGYIGIGATTATGGDIRVQSGASFQARNAANSANISLLATTGANNIVLGDNTNASTIQITGSTGVSLFYSTDERLTIGSTTGTFKYSGGDITIGGGYVGIGSNTSTTGNIRVPNNTVALSARNDANTNNLSIAASDDGDNLFFGSANSPALYYDASTNHIFRIASSSIASISSSGLSATSFADSAGTTSTTGLIRGKNNTTLITARNAANSADIDLLAINSSNAVSIATGATSIGIGPLNTATIYLGGNSGGYNTAFVAGGFYLSGGGYNILNGNARMLSYGSTGTISTTGIIRAENNVIIAAARNAANSANLEVLGTNTSNHLYIGGAASATAAVQVFSVNSQGYRETVMPAASGTAAANTITYEYVFADSTNTSGATTNRDIDLSNLEGINFATGTSAIWAQVEHIAYRATSNFATYATCAQAFRFSSTWAESGTADSTTTRDVSGNAFTTPTLAMSGNNLRYSHTAPATTDVVHHRIKIKIFAAKIS